MLWPAVSLAATVPLLLLQYLHYKKVSLGRMAMLYCFVLYLLVLVGFTIYPLPDNLAAFCQHHHIVPQLTPLQSILEMRTDGIRAVLQVSMNVLFFVPLGVFLRTMHNWRFTLVVALAFAMSLLIETAQLTGVFGIYPCSYRLFDVDDLLLNTFGAVLGLVVARFLPALYLVEKRDASPNLHPGLVRRFVATVVDVAAVTILQFLAAMGIYAYAIITNSQHAVLPAEINAAWLMGTFVVTMVWQGMMPLLAKGRTLGGWMTGMTLDDRPRRRFHRVVYYLVRLAWLLALWHAPPYTVPLILLPSLWYWRRHKTLPYTAVDWVFLRGKQVSNKPVSTNA